MRYYDPAPIESNGVLMTAYYEYYIIQHILFRFFSFSVRDFCNFGRSLLQV
ncbi:hypothetical protein NTE_00274 [Candidatus Nitrososphaera evergladensis SR1]|uniref:Uncharacterized protein n=1 Tax=Candidatus Nitrososphaera evergladensis SR1 TaxID=1459636 RepID=A0A075MLL0_9ARCH|nr:hypothetical protein NTE_00274 [Candidatus Nitrososphaera evergladensis SR1]